MQPQNFSDKSRPYNESGAGSFGFEKSKPIESKLNDSSQVKKRIIAVAEGALAEKIKHVLSQDHILVVVDTQEAALAFLRKYDSSNEHCDLVMCAGINASDSLSFNERIAEVDKNVPFIVLYNLTDNWSDSDKNSLRHVFPSSFSDDDFRVYLSGLLSKSGEKGCKTKLNLDELAEMRKNARIIIVDDEASLARLCTRILTKNGYSEENVVTILNRHEALKLIGEQEFDMILSDFNMPDMDYHIFRERALKAVKEKFNKTIPILLASGDLEQVYKLEAIADVYLPKPFEQKNLVEFVDDLLLKAKQERRQDEV